MRLTHSISAALAHVGDAWPKVDRANIGCGMTPTPGWRNYDNSFSGQLAHKLLLRSVLYAAGLVTPESRKYIAFLQANDVRWADAVRRIPEADGALDALYSSHKVEHLHQDEARSFLAEAMRVLRKGGVLRLAVPDLRFHVENYLTDQDAHKFVANIHVASPKHHGLASRLRSVLIGERHHLWMYDGTSIRHLVEKAGFADARIMPPGETRIPNPGPLDLAERVPESVFVEALRP